MWIAGCGSSPLVMVSGTVSYDGTPIDLGSIRFDPADGKGPSAEAKIEAGKYNVDVAPGKKKVFITGLKQNGFTTPGGPDGPKIPAYEEIVPAKYNTASDLTHEITGGATGVDFNLAK